MNLLAITLSTSGHSTLLRWDLRVVLEYQQASRILGDCEWSMQVLSSHPALWPALGSALRYHIVSGPEQTFGHCKTWDQFLLTCSHQETWANCCNPSISFLHLEVKKRITLMSQDCSEVLMKWDR